MLIARSIRRPLSERPKSVSFPPHTIIARPAQTAVGIQRLEGALIVLVALQLFVAGLNLLLREEGEPAWRAG